jgi:DNA-binding CsgD family transcriptional regulator
VATQRQPLFRGRASERAVLDRLLEKVRDGQSAALVIHGEAGVGKSALVRYAVRQASGFRVAEIAGVESEMELAYAGLHLLCAPMLAHLDALPEPQQRAVLVAFGLSSGDAPDRFLVALATLGLLAQVAEERPLLCVVEDAQWLDDTSAQVLGFVARRLLAESVAMVFAVREPNDQRELVGLPDLPLGGLPEADARAVLATVVPGRLDESVGDRIIAETRGNPLALLELPRGMSVAELAGGFALPDTGDLPGHIEERYRRRLIGLPEPTQRLMLLAAADPVGDATLLWRAAHSLGIASGAARPAVTEQLLDIGAHVRFSHPLVRSAVYRSSSPADRLVTHDALAAATDAETDPDRRAWHRAQATSGPDEEVAAELERSAGRAQARGGLAAAAAFLQRSADLSVDPTRRGQRMLAAAQFDVEAGAFDTALGLLAAAESGPLDDFGHARVDMLRAQLALASRRGNEATPLLLAAARRLEQLDLELARSTYVDAFAAALFGGRLNDRVGVPDVARAARDAPRRSDQEPIATDLLLDAFSALSDDYDTAVPICRDALQQICGDKTSPRENLRWLWHATVIALELWDDEASSFASQHHLEIARKTGALTELWVALSSRTPVLVFCGELAAASSLVAEAQSVSEATGITGAPYGGLILAAWRGQARMATELIEVTMREAGSRGEGIGIAICEYARAVLCNALGQYEEALAAARSATDDRELVVPNWAMPELIESATRAGRSDLASDALARLARKARASGTDWACGIALRSQALVSEGDIAERCFRDAIEHLSRTRVRGELARSHLLYGEWLRREGRRVQARAQLRTAHDMFATIGMDAFTDRARRELLATGETVRKRTVETRSHLTAQEEQIARLARDGLSNPEIGTRLYISARTVEWHLRKVFTKLEISSRKGLHDALPTANWAAARA